MHAVLELGIITVIVLLEATFSHTFALGGAAIQVYPVAVAVTELRLDPRLSLFCGFLAASLHGMLAVSLWDASVAAIPHLGPVPLILRCLWLVLLGLLCAMFSRALRQFIVKAVEEAEERLRVRAAFGSYVADQVVERVLSGDLTPTTERREISVLFADIRGFTRLSEGMDPETLLTQLNTVLEAFSDQIQAQGGIVNKYLGDGVMAIFGAPEDQPDHALRACRSALGMYAAALDLADSDRFPDLRIGIGVHCGEVVVGDVGGRGQREYTAIVDVVNVASRIESANKDTGTSMLISAEVRRSGGEAFATRALPPLHVRNRREPVAVFELLFES